MTIDRGRPCRLMSYDAELAKTKQDIATLEAIIRRDGRDVEKRVRIAYRQYHLASMTANELHFECVKQTIFGIIRDFGPKEDVCLLKANLDGRFHRLEEVKQSLAMCPSLARRQAGKAVMADIDFLEGRYEHARNGLEQLIDEQQTWDVLARLAHWHAKLGDPDEADRLYEVAEDELTAKEMRAFAWLERERGAQALSRGRLSKARAHFNRAAASFPGHWQTDEQMANMLAAEGNFEEASALLRDVIRRSPKPELKQELGKLLTAMERTEEARLWLEAAESAFLASVQEGEVHYYHHLADLYADALNRPAEAVQWARKDVALRSNFSTQSALAWALFKSGEVAEGLEWILRALASGVRDGSIFATASALFHATGDTMQGDYYARAAAAINPGDHRFRTHH
jgi:tetratricopeptide (TPR) repeat protein